MRLHTGTPPPDALQLATLWHGDETWFLMLRALHERGTWLNLKLVTAHPVPFKANYWLGWSLSQARFAKTKDAATLSAGRPALYGLVGQALRAVVELVGDPRITGLDEPLGFRATPSTPLVTPFEGVKGVTPVEAAPQAVQGSPTPYSRGPGPRGQTQTDQNSTSLGDPDEDLL